MNYYLYKNGRLTGPITSEKLEEWKRNGKYFDFHWIIDSKQQIWRSVGGPPAGNPFHVPKHSADARSVSAAFSVSKDTYVGEVARLDSFGVDVVLKNVKRLLRGYDEHRIITLNLCDEINLVFVNAKVFLQDQKLTGKDLEIRFHWDEGAVVL